MKKQTKSVLNNNIDFIQLKLFDFSKEGSFKNLCDKF